MHVATASQLTAPNQSVDAANGVTYAYRRFGNTDGAAPPLLFLQHFRGNLDNWDPPDASRLNRLAGITQPVFVANGDNDRMVPTKNSHLLASRLPDARVEIYPDAGHGFLFQYPAEFAADVDKFLAG
jgi:pimeloyl-ACP methyl ester carboxylesterase